MSKNDYWALVNITSLKESPDAFRAVLLKNIKEWIKTGDFEEIVKVYDKSVRTPEIDKIINQEIVNYACKIPLRKRNKYSYQAKLRSEFPKIIDGWAEFMDDDTKLKVLSEILKKQDSFYPHARKALAQSAVNLSSSDKELTNALNIFYKIMDKKTFLSVVDKITDGFDNPGVKKILDKTKRFHVCRYNKSEVKNDIEKRVELLKDIARTPTSVKNLNFMISFGIDDLKKMASVMRFNFLQWYFSSRFACASRNYSRPDQYKAQLPMFIKRSGVDKINIDTMKEGELKELLFSVGLKKNAEVTKFVEKYKAYKIIESGGTLSREDVKSAFGFGYYYW